MFIRLLILFLVVPVIEIFLLLQMGSLIGVAPTVILILATGIAGAYLARTQGFETLSRIREELEKGVLPAAPLLDGAMVLAGGILLLTPGFCTDLCGFILLVPVTRAWLKRLLGPWLARLTRQGTITIHGK